MLKQMISRSTRKNWERLQSGSELRLARRANKRLSTKKIVPLEYFCRRDNTQAVEKLLLLLNEPQTGITDLLCSVAEKLFRRAGIWQCRHVREVLSHYPYRLISGVDDCPLPEGENDLLGLIYQSSLPEGIKNQRGSYYTPLAVTREMVRGLAFQNGKTLLDPCCGSGAFLLAADCDDPNLLFGVESDAVAAMLAKFNLLLRYPDKKFIPNIVCGDFLLDDLFPMQQFDHIVTNPPWGAATEKINDGVISSGESFSHFFVKSHRKLKPEGTLRFLLPQAVLNVKIHRDLRNFILNECRLESITGYGNIFSGVVTGFADIKCRKSASSGPVLLKTGDRSFEIDPAMFSQSENCVFSFLTPQDVQIIRKCRKAGVYNLSGSIWAMGIVTGDNKAKLSTVPAPGLEAIYTGKELAPYHLKEPRYYIRYDRKSFQQTAKDEYYRAPEKLIYKFISGKLVFAYDDRQSLVLNSANILIPAIPGMSIKTAMALLNSELFSFLHHKISGEVKILKGNLLNLPFPAISSKADRQISDTVDRIIAGDTGFDRSLQSEIYALFGLSDNEITYIRSCGR